MSLPPAKMTTTFVPADNCAVCGREWVQGQIPVPTIYTVASIEAGLPPHPIRDYCVEQHSPALFEELLADRRRFYAN